MAGAIAYGSLLTVALTAYWGLSWTILLAGAAVLTAISVLEQRRYRSNLAAIGREDFLHTAAMASLSNGLLAAGAAYAVGFVVRSLLGA